jgi:hypothetical protein
MTVMTATTTGSKPRNWVRRAGAIALLAATAAALAGPGSRPAAARPLATGITDPLATYEAQPLAFQRMRAAGARFVRLTIGWTEVAPRTKPGQWNPEDPNDPHYWWPSADREVTGAVAAGLTPVIAVTDAPSWAQSCNSSQGYPGSVCGLDVAAYAEFAKAIARHYSGSTPGLPEVRYWQPQNEPNLPLFFNPQFAADGRPTSPEEYRAVLSAFSAAVKAVNRSSLVVSAGLAPLERPGGLGPLDFARRLLCMRGRRHPRPAPVGCAGGVPLDIFAINPYTTGGPTHRAQGADDVSLGDLPKLTRLLRAADRAHHIRGAFRNTPLWITEFSWDSRPPDPGGLRQRLLARWISEALYRAWRAGVKAFFWFGLRDEARDGRPPNQTAESGLYTRGATLEADQPKPSLEAFRFPFVALSRRHGFFVWGRTPNSEPGWVSVQVHGHGRWRTIARLRAAGGGIFESTLHRRYSRHGSVRAVYGEERSLAFSLRYVEDFYQPPFG